MRINGTLTFNRITGGGFDANRNPTAATTTWSDPVDCMITRTGKSNLYNIADGKYVASHFEVQIEEEPPTILVTDVQTLIRLTDDRGMYLGEFPLLAPNIVHMDTLERLKLIV